MTDIFFVTIKFYRDSFNQAFYFTSILQHQDINKSAAYLVQTVAYSNYGPSHMITIVGNKKCHLNVRVCFKKMDFPETLPVFVVMLKPIILGF